MKSTLVIYYLLKLKKNIFLNSLKKYDTWMKIISGTLLFIIFFYSLQLLNNIVIIFKGQFSLTNEYRNAIFDMAMFSFFILNVFAVFFMSNLTTKTTISVLSRFPISLNEIIIYCLVESYMEYFNIFFILLYFSIYFLIGGVILSLNFMLFCMIFILFSFLVNNTIFLIRNVANLILYFHRPPKIAMFIIIAMILLAVVIIPIFSSIFSFAYNVIKLSTLLSFSPSSIFSFFIKNIGLPNLFTRFMLTASYFVIFNYVIYIINLNSLKKLFSVKFAVSPMKVLSKKSFFSFTIANISINPIFRKNIIYFFRSPNTKVESNIKI